MMHLKKVLDTGCVTRYHATGIFNKQANSEHQWGVAIILLHIFPEASSHLKDYALIHDAGEWYSGDVPGPVKRDNPQLKELLDQIEDKYRDEVLRIPPFRFSPREYLALKWADILEGLYFTNCRVKGGDQFALHSRDTFIRYACALDHLNNRADTALSEFRDGC